MKEKMEFEDQVEDKKIQYNTAYLTQSSEKHEVRRMFFDLLDSYISYYIGDNNLFSSYYIQVDLIVRFLIHAHIQSSIQVTRKL